MNEAMGKIPDKAYYVLSSCYQRQFFESKSMANDSAAWVRRHNPGHSAEVVELDLTTAKKTVIATYEAEPVVGQRWNLNGVDATLVHVSDKFLVFDTVDEIQIAHRSEPLPATWHYIGEGKP